MSGFPDFFDLPVYRLTEEKYYADLERYTDERIEAAGGPNRNANAILHIRQHSTEAFGGPWEYNEIIGYIRLHFVGSQIRGEYFAPASRRVVKSRRKIFWMQTHKLAPEVQISFNPTSQSIFKLIVEYVDACKAELPRRYIDSRQLMRLGPFVDWKGLYESV